MKQKKAIASVILLNCLSIGNVYSSDSNIVVPDEFASMFESEPIPVTVQLIGSSASIQLMMEATPFDSQLHESSLEDLSEYLKSENVRFSAIDAIKKSMLEGVRNDPLCTGIVSACQLMPEDYAFGYDYEHQLVLLFVHASLLQSKSSQNEPHSAHNSAPGLINHIDLDANYYQDGDGNVTLRDDTILGLPYGNISSKIYANTNDDVTVDELSYNFEWDEYRLQAGHYEYGYAQNSTGMLDLLGTTPRNVVSLSSSQNLINRENRKQRQLSYFLPGQGRIEIYRDDRLVLGKNVSAGQQTVNYSNLPSGNYLATIVIISQGKEILREQRQIYNTSTFSLGKGDLDYSISAGQFEKRYDEDSYFDDLKLSSDAFVDGRLNYQLFDNTLLGVRSSVTQEHYLLEGVASHEFDQYATIIGKYAVFDNDSKYWSVDGSLLGFGVGYERYELDNYDYSLNNYMVGNTGYKRITASAGTGIFGGSGYLMYINNKSDDYTLLGQDFSDQSSYWSLTAGYSHPFVAGSMLDLSFSWQGNNDSYFNDSDEWSATLLWTVPLGASWNGMSSLSFNDDGINEFRNSVSKDTTDENFYTSTELGVSYNDRTVERSVMTDASFSGGYTDESFSASTYLYAKSDGTRSANVNFSSSQIFDGDNIYLSSEKSDAYVVVDSDNQGDSDNHIGLLTLEEDGVVDQHRNIDTQKTVIPVDKYNQYHVNLDTDSSNYIVGGKRDSKEYSFPGSVITLAVDLTKIKSFITSFEDISERNIDEIQCKGDGCVDVEKLTDGVFKVSVVVGADYQLVTNNQTCVTPTLDRKTSKIVNLGVNYCLPGIDDDSVQLASLQSINIRDKNYYFVGVYRNNQDLDQAANEVESTGLDAIKRNVGQHHYLYATADDSLTISQRQQLETLWRYAVRTLETDRWVLWR